MKKHQLVYALLSVVAVGASNSTLAENQVVGQKNKAFTVDELTIKKGESVDFLNEDPFFHNVFSLSDAKLFDLGSFPQGESRTVVFEDAGDVEVECAIHPDMLMTIHVTE